MGFFDFFKNFKKAKSDNSAPISPAKPDNSAPVCLEKPDNGVLVSPTKPDNGAPVSPAKLDNSTPASPAKPFMHDKAKYQWDSAAEEYCLQVNKTIDELYGSEDPDDFRIIEEYAGNHIAFFLTWIIQNGFYNLADLPEDIAEAAESVKNEKMTGIEFLMCYCDGVMGREDLKPEIRGFADAYYDPDYLDAYTRFVESELHKTPLGIRFSWEEYHKFKHIIDTAYEKHKKQYK